MGSGAQTNTIIFYHVGTITEAAGTGRALLLLEDGDGMAGIITPGVVKDLVGTVVVAATGAPFTGTALAIIRLEQDGDADDGKYWDANDDTWQASPVTWPVATATTIAGQHFFQLPVAATSSRTGARLSVTFTDNVVEATSTTLAGTYRYLLTPMTSEITALVGHVF